MGLSAYFVFRLLRLIAGQWESFVVTRGLQNPFLGKGKGTGREKKMKNLCLYLYLCLHLDLCLEQSDSGERQGRKRCPSSNLFNASTLPRLAFASELAFRHPSVRVASYTESKG
jgi:hypothetical protein